VERREKVNQPKIPLETTDRQAVPEGLRILARMIARTLYRESRFSEIESPNNSCERTPIDENTEE
jgi:hypothetical protein